MSSLQQAHWDTENKKDLEYSNLRCLDYMKQVFVTLDQQQIFQRIDGPYHNQIEVMFHKSYFNKVREIEERYIGVLASKMTDISRAKCFDPWPAPLTPDSMEPWTPPKAVSTDGRIANPYKKSGAAAEYSLTKNSKLSYKDASTLGRRQIDNPLTLVVPKSSTPSKSTTSATTLTASTTKQDTKQDSAIVADIKAEQKRFQREYDEKLKQINILTASLDLAIAKVERETKRAHKSITSLGTEVKAKYTQTQALQKASETRITSLIKKQTEAASTDAALSKKWMKQIMQTLKNMNNPAESDEDYDDDEDEEDTIMQNKHQHTEIHPGSLRTNHPKGKNKSLIHQRSRTSSRVAYGEK